MARFTDFIPMQKELRQTKADLAAARAEIERLTKAHDTVCGALAEAIKRAEKAEAGRDEARAQVAAAFKAAADVLFDHGDGTVEIALDKRLCCNGYQCGCQGATVGLYLQHLIRSLTPAHAKAALEAYGREKVREGVQRAADIARTPDEDDDQLDRQCRIIVAAQILAAMEKEGEK